MCIFTIIFLYSFVIVVVVVVAVILLFGCCSEFIFFLIQHFPPKFAISALALESNFG